LPNKKLLFVLAFLLAACQSGPPTVEPSAPAGNDISVNLPRGNVERGKQLVLNRGCLACHGQGAGIGPDWQDSEYGPGIGERGALRIAQEDYTGRAQTPEQYLFESIVQPGVYVVEGFPGGLMPDAFGDLVKAQELSDILAFMMTIK
jgi:mono/diheme cytochrome c family protein